MARQNTKGRRPDAGKTGNPSGAGARPPLQEACLFGAHAVAAALANPKRVIKSLHVTETWRQT